MKANSNFLSLKQSYLFSEISNRVAVFANANPKADVIRMGIGDVTQPLCGAVTDAITAATAEMSKKESFRGYGPEQGYAFLREAIRDYYAKKGVSLDPDEIFVSDGAKSDTGNILDIFALDNKVLVPDPVYPVYVDTNGMLGREVAYLKADEQNGFLPLPDADTDADIIYLCSPNNPTGAVYNREQLTQWVDYARERKAVILFDAAYECFVVDKSLPRSIFEIEGAKECAIEFCSFSKTAGFTGTRCGYTVVPSALKDEKGVALRQLWLRRQTTKFNGVAYVIQRGAQAVFSDEGQRQISAALDYYRENARVISDTMKSLGIYYTGGVNSPYIWFKCPGGMSSWDFFDKLLSEANVVGTPGSGFGANGEGYFRLTAFGDAKKTKEAMQRLANML